MRRKGSYFFSNTVANAGQRNFSVKNAYQLEFINNTMFAIEVLERNTGKLTIPANSSIKLSAHPDYPLEYFSSSVIFKNEALEQDSLIILSTVCYGGRHSKKI